jgi:DNA-binding PadR family transcriptional regulator
MKSKIKYALIAVLHTCDGIPAPELALLSATRILVQPAQPTDSDILEVLRELESLGFVSGVTDELTQEKTWTLSPKGTHKARQVR